MVGNQLCDHTPQPRAHDHILEPCWGLLLYFVQGCSREKSIHGHAVLISGRMSGPWWGLIRFVKFSPYMIVKGFRYTMASRLGEEDGLEGQSDKPWDDMTIVRETPLWQLD